MRLAPSLAVATLLALLAACSDQGSTGPSDGPYNPYGLTTTGPGVLQDYVR